MSCELPGCVFPLFEDGRCFQHVDLSIEDYLSQVKSQETKKRKLVPIPDVPEAGEATFIEISASKNGRNKAHVQRRKKYKVCPRLCIYPGCKTSPAFGFEGKCEYCGKHKQDGMVPYRKKPICVIAECEKTATRGSPLMYCAKHAPAGVLPPKSQRCTTEGCASYPVWKNSGDRRYTKCNKHRDAGMLEKPRGR